MFYTICFSDKPKAETAPDNMDSGIDNSITFVESKLGLHTFESEIMERKILFQIVKMQDSLLIYVNHKDNTCFSDLSLAIKERFGNKVIGTKIVGNLSENSANEISCRIALKTGKTVFLSCNVDIDARFIPLLEKRLYDEMKAYPDKF